MAGYIPSDVPRKKAAALEKREALLLNELRSFSNPTLLHKFAEQVREAKLGYLKAKRHFAVKPAIGELPVCNKIDLEMEQWKRKPIAEIIESYGKVAKVRSHNS